MRALALLITLSIIFLFGITGIYNVLGLLVVWQLIYRLNNGYWMEGIN